MRYESIVYRPPSEADSVLIQATIGCPHNRCIFCPMYKGTKFRIKTVDEIQQDLDYAHNVVGEDVRSVFFPDGNTIIMKTDELVEVLSHTRKFFPSLQRITVYGSAKFIKRKTVEELKLLHNAGLTRIHMGIESGDPDILERIKKGASPDDMISAGKKVIEAGIELSVYIMVGIGGKTDWENHAYNSACVVNAINPDFIRLRTTVPVPGTPLYDQYLDGTFHLQDAHDALREMKRFVENLDVDSYIVSDHVSNYWNVEGNLPGDKDRILNGLEYGLSLDLSCFRGSLIGRQL